MLRCHNGQKYHTHSTKFRHLKTFANKDAQKMPRYYGIYRAVPRIMLIQARQSRTFIRMYTIQALLTHTDLGAGLLYGTLYIHAHTYTLTDHTLMYEI